MYAILRSLCNDNFNEEMNAVNYCQSGSQNMSNATSPSSRVTNGNVTSLRSGYFVK